MAIGEKIKSIREKCGYSQVDLADKIGVSKQTLYKYENNIITNIPSDKIEEIASICNTTPAYLMGWEEASITTKWNTLTSFHREELDRYASYMLESERQLNSKNNMKYIDFNIATIVSELNDTGKKEAYKRVSELKELSRYSCEEILSAAHARTDIDIPEDADISEDNIMDNENF